MHGLEYFWKKKQKNILTKYPTTFIEIEINEIVKCRDDAVL